MPPPNIIFICYVNRSGSTYLANLFSKSPEICVCPEADILVDIFLVEPLKVCSQKSISQFKLALANNNKLKSWNLIDDEIDLLTHINIECFLLILNKYLASVKPFAKTLVFKAERLIQLYKYYSPELNLRYQIKWISIIRDCRAVYYSQKRTINPESEKRMSDNPIHTALFWNSSVRKSLSYSSKSDFYLVFYEYLIYDLQNQVEKIINLFSLKSFNLNDSPGDLKERMPLNHYSIHNNITQHPLLLTVNEWYKGLSEVEIFTIQLLSKKLLIHCGYKLKIIHRQLWFQKSRILFTATLYYINLYLKILIYKILYIFRIPFPINSL